MTRRCFRRRLGYGGKDNEQYQASSGISSDAGLRDNMDYPDLPLSNLYLTMLPKLGVGTESFDDSTETFSGGFGESSRCPSFRLEYGEGHMIRT